MKIIFMQDRVKLHKPFVVFSEIIGFIPVVTVCPNATPRVVLRKRPRLNVVSII